MWPQTHSTTAYIALYDSMIISVIICNLHFFLGFPWRIYFLVHIGYPTPESIMYETDELCPLARGLICSICDNAAWDMLISLIIHGLVLGARHKAKRLVLQCINGVSSNPVEGRTKIWQLKELILTLFGLFFRRIYLRNNSNVFEELEVSIVDLTVANAVLLALFF
jgi:hypothetical protein